MGRNTEEAVLSKSHQDGPLVREDIVCSQYKCYKTLGWKLKIEFPDNSVMLFDESIVMVSNIVQIFETNQVYIIGKRYKIIGPIYKKLCPSSILKCFAVENHLSIKNWRCGLLLVF